MTTTELPRLMTTREVAEALRMSPGRVADFARAGHIPAIRIGERGELRFRTDDIARLVSPRARKEVRPDEMRSSPPL
jgi:excisionase family DNA binding protein